MRILPLLIMGVMSVTAGVATFFLPETLGASLPQTLEDAENFGASSYSIIVSSFRILNVCDE